MQEKESRKIEMIMIAVMKALRMKIKGKILHICIKGILPNIIKHLGKAMLSLTLTLIDSIL